MNNIHKNYWNTHQRSVKEKPHGVARVISKRGFCSRSQAENLVREGRVSLRGKIVRDPDAPAYENDKILVDGKAVTANAFVYFMMNKPRGYVTTANDEKGRATVIDLFRERFCKMFPGKPVPHISPVGRLDAASEGLLLFTNDTQWANNILEPRGGSALQQNPSALSHPKQSFSTNGRESIQFQSKDPRLDERRKTKDEREACHPRPFDKLRVNSVEGSKRCHSGAEGDRIHKISTSTTHTKVYRVQVAGHPTAEDFRKMEEGFNVPPRVFGEKEEFMHAVRAVLHRESDKTSWLEITLDEGKNREIRRMLAHLGYEVLRLVRIKFCNYELGDLKQGEIKEIHPNSEQTTV